MPKETSSKIHSSPSWRSIRQKGTPAVTPEAKKKAWLSTFKWVSFFVLALFSLLATGSGIFYFKTSRASVNMGYLSQALSHIEVYTDGVLPESTILKASGVEEGTLMMNIDIF